MPKIMRTREIPVYENPYLTFFDDEVRFPDGSGGRYVRLCWKYDFSVGVVPVTPDREILLIEQFCYATQRAFPQIPKGMGMPGKSPEEVAHAELAEELGAVCASLVPLTRYFVDPGLIENPIHIFLALDTRITGPVHHENSEVILGTRQVPLAALRTPQMLGGIVDPITIASLFLAAEYLDSARTMR